MPKPHISPRNAHNPALSILSADVSIKGDVCASVDLQVDGRIEGDICCEALVQGQESEIVGAVSAKSVRISGTVHGTICAPDVTILKSARIIGDVAYHALTIEQGARIEGHLNPNGGKSVPNLLALEATSYGDNTDMMQATGTLHAVAAE